MTTKQSRKKARDFVEKNVSALSAGVLIWRKSASLPPKAQYMNWRVCACHSLPMVISTLKLNA